MICANCDKPLTKADGVVEHIVPLSRGGKNIETNTRMVHIGCHRRKQAWYKRLWRAYCKWYGDLMCKLGRHAWRPAKGAVIEIDWRSKWEAYEVASKGVCARCGVETTEIRRDYYW